MSGSNVVAVKKRFFELLATQPSLAGVDVDYAWRRHFGREMIYGGSARIVHDFHAMRGAGRVPRDEQVNLTVVIEVRNLRSDAIAAEERVVALLTVLEEFLAGDPTLSGVAGLLFAGVRSVEFGEPDFDDDGVTGTAIVEIGYRSHLT